MPILDTFRQSRVHDARLDLRQGDGRGDALIATVGVDDGLPSSDAGEPIAGTRLRIGRGEPQYFLLFSRDLFTLLLVGILA